MCLPDITSDEISQASSLYLQSGNDYMLEAAWEWGQVQGPRNKANNNKSSVSKITDYLYNAMICLNDSPLFGPAYTWCQTVDMTNNVW